MPNWEFRRGTWGSDARNPLYFRNPTAADYYISVIKHHGLSWGDGALRMVERYAHLSVCGGLKHRGRRLMAMADFCLHAHRHIRISAGLMQSIDGDPIQLVCDQRP